MGMGMGMGAKEAPIPRERRTGFLRISSVKGDGPVRWCGGGGVMEAVEYWATG